MNIIHRTTDAESIDVIEMYGEIVMANSPSIREQIQEIINRGKGQVLIDLKDVNFMDSSGLSVLVSALKTIRLKNGNLALLKLSPEVKTLIELTRLHQIFDIFEEENLAVERLRDLAKDK
jgi:anti-sigma B factor antagonist